MIHKTAALLAAALLLTSCGDQTAADSVMDLSAVSRTMQYSQITQMLYEPAPYLGETVQICGQYYKGSHDAIIRVLDEQACCAAEITVFPTDSSEFDGIENFSEITVRGVFGTYDGGGMEFCCLHQTERIE